MIVVDTSALMAVVLSEPDAQRCKDALTAAPQILISVGTMTETLIVAHRRNVLSEIIALLASPRIEVVVVGSAGARRAAQAHVAWGRGMHPAGLNFGDCFAYALAKERDAPLLFVGRDFSQTDIVAA